MRRLSLTPLAWGFGLGLGAALALGLGAYAPSWGMALAFPAVTLLFSGGALKEDDGDEMRNLLRFAVGFTVAFLAVNAPLTWIGLGELAARAGDDPETGARVILVRQAVLARWAVISLGIPGGAATLWVRRSRKARPPDRGARQ